MDETSTGGMDHPDPEDDPHACSLCGVHIGSFPRGEYCDGCAREIGARPPLRRCESCGNEYPEERMKAIDVSPPDEYYPQFVFVCNACNSDTDT